MIPEENTPENTIAQAYLDHDQFVTDIDADGMDETELAKAIVKRLNEHGYVIVGIGHLDHGAHACYELGRDGKSADWVHVGDQLRKVHDEAERNGGWSQP